MIRIILWNISIICSVLVITIAFSHKYLVSKKLIGSALKGLEDLRSHPEYHPDLEKVGWLSFRKTPTSFINLKLDPNKIKIGCFGDSHTEGIESAPGNDYPSVLQKILGDKYQVINFGQGGHGFHQIYTLAKYYTKKYDLDYILLGPRGFYLERSTSFNKYWSGGTLPYSRYRIVNNKLDLFEVEGRNSKEKIINYYKLLPSSKLVFEDHVPPSFFKMGYLLYGLDMKNPFYKVDLEREREIQRQQIIDLANNETPIIHFTDFKEDCEAFKSIEHKYYKLFCHKSFIERFPYQAEISHPSSFGYYFHALDAARFIKEEMETSDKYNFSENEDDYRETKETSESKRVNIHKLGVWLKNKKIACLGPNRGYANSLGQIQNFNSDDQDVSGDALVGFYQKGESKSGGMFLKIPQTLINNIGLNRVKLLSLKDINNVYFYEAETLVVDLANNKIKSWDTKLDRYLENFFHVEKKKEEFVYSPKFPSYKMIIDYYINAYELLHHNKIKDLSLKIKESKSCPFPDNHNKFD